MLAVTVFKGTLPKENQKEEDLCFLERRPQHCILKPVKAAIL